MEISPENFAKLSEMLVDLGANIAVLRKILTDAGIVDEATYESLYQAKKQEIVRDYQHHG